MSKIKILSQHEAHKIAAGEVIERPANIIKELVENAIDAQATVITIFIVKAGKQSIRIIDNGQGMSHQDALLCCEKYATSKISCVQELETITTFGFRGEALASIAAVSTCTLRTKEKDALYATHIVTKEGTKTVSHVAGNIGTEIIIEDLFSTIPARKKFLKTDATELRHIKQLIDVFALTYPSIFFKLYSDDALLLNYSPVETLLQRTHQLCPPQTVDQLIAVTHKRNDDSITLDGFISNHQYGLYDRSSIFFIVNNRWIKNSKLTSAVLKGYHNVIQQNRFPISCIRITINPTLVDINIHPRKEEVRFMHPVLVEQLIVQMVKQSLEQHLTQQIKNQPTHINPFYTQQPNDKKEHLFPSSEKIFMHNFSVAQEKYNIHSGITIKSSQPNTSVNRSPTVSLNDSPDNLLASTQTDISVDNSNGKQSDFVATSVHILGQYNNTYIIAQKENGLFLIDQHAAHERVLYELFSKNFDKVITVELLFANIITLSKNDVELIVPYLHLFEKNGIMVEAFGNNTLIVKSTPIYFKSQSVHDLLQHAVSWIQQTETLDCDGIESYITQKLHAQIACKAAVKAGDVLTNETMTQLLHDLALCSNNFCCPHGRPTSWLIPLYEIERKFKRK